MSNKQVRIFVPATEPWWWCHGPGNANEQWNRTSKKSEAIKLDEVNAVRFKADFRRYGYRCKIRPKIPKNRQLEILMLNTV